MAATPAHYIRTIQTSFTAAHPRNSPSAWASAAASPRYTAGPLAHSPSQKEKDMHLQTQQPPHTATQFNQYPLHQHQTQQHAQYNPPPIASINTHNQHAYTHHLYALHGGYPQYPATAIQGQGYNQGLRKGPGASGRRRSASIRMPPTYGPHRGRTSPAYKFDPFADDEASLSVPLSVTSPLTGSAQANRAASELDEPLPKPSAPYTIHIPAAQPTEIQQYTPPASPRPAARTATLRSLIPINGPLPGTAPTATAASMPDRMAPKQVQPNPNLSKIVAGILLNRVHAVGKPMRRRVAPHLNGEGEKGYRKSCLSSVVSVEA